MTPLPRETGASTMPAMRRLPTVRLPLPWITCLAACLAACQSAPPVAAPQPLFIPAARHDLALKAAAGTLRDLGFRIERFDVRMGVVSTEPEGIPTSGEWWHGNAPVRSDWEAKANLQDLRHRVRLTLAPKAVGEGGLPAPATGYLLSAEAAVERLDTPTRRVTAGWSNPSSRLSEVPEHWRTRGVEDALWQPVGRDHALEQAILDDVEKRMQ